MLESYIGNLKRQLHVLGSDRAKLETELSTMQVIMEDHKKKFKKDKSSKTRARTDFLYLLDGKVCTRCKISSRRTRVLLASALGFHAEVEHLEVVEED